MNHHATPAPAILIAIPQPLLAREVDQPADLTGKRALVIRLLAQESTLYAITRNWRYDSAGRKSVRLHALLDQQFSQIGLRLVRLAKRSRDLGCRDSMGSGDRAESTLAAVRDDRLESQIIRELLVRHEAMLSALREGTAVDVEDFQDTETTLLVADLIASHEEDAFMLRALLWEIENTAA